MPSKSGVYMPYFSALQYKVFNFSLLSIVTPRIMKVLVYLFLGSSSLNVYSYSDTPIPIACIFQ